MLFLQKRRKEVHLWQENNAMSAFLRRKLESQDCAFVIEKRVK